MSFQFPEKESENLFEFATAKHNRKKLFFSIHLNFFFLVVREWLYLAEWENAHETLE